MAFVNFARKEISFKIVYYGPALCGKMTNVEQIHKAVDAADKGQLTMLSTQQDRTLYFDFLPLKSDIIKGFSSKFQVYTVPGQVIYNETRKLVLRNVDGVVFVADSQWSRMAENAESFKNLEGNLQTLGKTLDEIPYILQFNKRDMPEVAPVHYMDFMLNQRAVRVPFLESVAATGAGVMEALNLIAKMVISDFIEHHKLSAAGTGAPELAVKGG